MNNGKFQFQLIALLLATIGAGCTVEVINPVEDLGNPVSGAPNQGVTDLYEQAEAVIAVARVPGDPSFDVVSVAYNDRTQDPEDPKIEYPSPTERTVHHGASMMGWSYSTDDGVSFTYGGRLEVPEGWAVLWGDPSLAAEAEHTYMANLAVSDASWSGDIVNVAMSGFDGFCVARSDSGGVSFLPPQCFKFGTCDVGGASCTADDQCSTVCNGVFYDGSALAIWGGHVWFAAQHVVQRRVDVWRAPLGTLDFEPFADLIPFDSIQTMLHPRFRAFGGRLYVAANSLNGPVVATYLEDPDGSWRPPLVISGTVFNANVVLSDRTIRQANQWSFAIGDSADQQSQELRIMQTAITALGKRFVAVVRCAADLPEIGNSGVAECADTTWATLMTPGDQFSPLLYAAGSPTVWKAVWLSRESDPMGNVIEVRQGNLTTAGNPPLQVLATGQIVPPQVPCDANTYWGDYNDLTQLIQPGDFGPSPRFITVFTRNGVEGECSFRTPWTADMHVSARVFQ